MISVQAHPEIEADYERALLDMFSGSLLPTDIADQGLASMQSETPDTQTLANWFAEFFLSRQAASNTASLQQAGA